MHEEHLGGLNSATSEFPLLQFSCSLHTGLSVLSCSPAPYRHIQFGSFGSACRPLLIKLIFLFFLFISTPKTLFPCTHSGPVCLSLVRLPRFKRVAPLRTSFALVYASLGVYKVLMLLLWLLRAAEGPQHASFERFSVLQCSVAVN